MATIFEFLEKYDKPAYKWAKNMERTLYKEPVSALGFGGRYLEAIRNGLYTKHYKMMKTYSVNLSKDSTQDKILGDSFKNDSDFDEAITHSTSHVHSVKTRLRLARKYLFGEEW